MIFTETKLKGAFIIEPEKLKDERGFFARIWCKKEFEAHGLNTRLVQTNVAFNKKKGVLRGMHYQVTPYEETKLIRCTEGAIYDVIIDLRESSPTYKQWIGVELTQDNYKMLYVPECFAHGYQTLQDNTEVSYQVSQFYAPNSEQGIRWNDPSFTIQWPEAKEKIISVKDQRWPDYR
ncbi:MAG: dTDP-4-dehydrorhamnose 3,5-epimerase [Candidatus Scalindua sp.]|nr:dTDP-4-dehydrorhamnose 3,5-epimerase [Candidatus Scalindua sp.]